MLNAKAIAEILGVTEEEVRKTASTLLIFGPNYAAHQVARIKRFILGK
jgi:hypothetical protein